MGTALKHKVLSHSLPPLGTLYTCRGTDGISLCHCCASTEPTLQLMTVNVFITYHYFKLLSAFGVRRRHTGAKLHV